MCLCVALVFIKCVQVAVFQIQYTICIGLFCGFSGMCQGQNVLPAADKMAAAQQLEREATTQRDSAKLAKAYYQFGKVFNARANYLQAQQYYTKALGILTRRADSYELGQVYLRMSELEAEQEHSLKCIEYARTALAIFERIGSDKGRMIAYGALNNGYVKIWMSQQQSDRQHPLWDTLWQYTRASERLAYQLQDSLAIAEISISMGSLYAHAQDRKALLYLNRGKDYFQKKARLYLYQLSSTWITLANAHLALGEPARAYEALRAGERVYRQMAAENTIDRRFLETYIRYHKATRNFPKAFEYAEKLRALESKILLADREGAISRLNIAYETEKKDAHIKNQQRELQLRAENERNQRLLLGVGLCLLLGAIATSVAFYRLYRRNRRISHQNEVLVKEQNHRVKNNLQVISSLLNLQARRLTDEAARRTMRESQVRIESMAILHRSLYEQEQLAQVYLPEFVAELVENVGQSFGYRPSEQRINIDPMFLDADKATLVGLILTELLTNAWKYAFPDADASVLRISATQNERMLEIIVADNGPGWDGTTDQKSLGIRIIRAQAAQLQAEYGFKQHQGTVFWLRFSNQTTTL